MSPRPRPARATTRRVLALITIALGLAAAAPAFAAGYTLPWSSLADGGITFATGSGYRLGGTIAQKVAGVRTGGGYTLREGFWAPNPPRVSAVTPDLPHGLPYRLVAPAPNPFHDATEFVFALPVPATATLEVFAVDGQRVRTLAHERFGAGDVRVRWDGTAENGQRAAAGIYFVRLDADGRHSVQRVVLLP